MTNSLFSYMLHWQRGNLSGSLLVLWPHYLHWPPPPPPSIFLSKAMFLPARNYHGCCWKILVSHTGLKTDCLGKKLLFISSLKKTKTVRLEMTPRTDVLAPSRRNIWVGPTSYDHKQLEIKSHFSFEILTLLVIRLNGFIIEPWTNRSKIRLASCNSQWMPREMQRLAAGF